MQTRVTKPLKVTPKGSPKSRRRRLMRSRRRISDVVGRGPQAAAQTTGANRPPGGAGRLGAGVAGYAFSRRPPRQAARARRSRLASAGSCAAAAARRRGVGQRSVVPLPRMPISLSRPQNVLSTSRRRCSPSRRPRLAPTSAGSGASRVLAVQVLRCAQVHSQGIVLSLAGVVGHTQTRATRPVAEVVVP